MPTLRRPLLLIMFLVLVAPGTGFAQAPATSPAAVAPATIAPAAPTSAAPTPSAVPQAPASAPAVPTPAVATAGTTPADLPHDLSFTNMILNADWVVKSVIALLALASVLTWTMAVAKTVEFILHGRSTRAGLQTLGASANLDEAARGVAGGACARFVGAARAELEASGAIGAEGIKERTAWKLDRLVAAAGRTMGRGTGLLATVGSVAPFVGLFGTVWGIMNSFIGISKSQTTNLAVVAPGIAEALLATAIGLVAAIPAVVIYNAFARATAGARARLADGVAETMRLLSRDLDRAAAASRPLARLHAAE